MNKLKCPRCENPFFTASHELHMPCPYCGYVVMASDSDRRTEGRNAAQRLCEILKGEVRVPVKTVDFSETGIGIKMTGYLPFDTNDTVDILVKELDIKKKARVMWTKKFYGISRAGLQFS